MPQDWRDANVTPIHKKGSRTSCSNYRPVSLTSQIVKIMERVVLKSILKLLQNNHTLSCHQHGFQDSSSCVTQLIECINDWTENCDEGLGTDVIYMDFAKAFDTVPHKRLLYKLKSVGIRGKALMWLSTFLSQRRQRVLLREASSDWGDVTSGVPQGSILGPILFLIYVNDIPDNISNTAKMFADDTKLYKPISNISDCHKLQQDLNSLAAWSNQWLLKFNESKCVVLRIKESFDYIYTLNGIPLNSVESQKDLGVTISKNLKPSSHIAIATKKANQRLGLIKRCFTDLSADKLFILYTSLVRPVIEYGSPTWNPQFQKDIESLDRVQKRAVALSPSLQNKLQPLQRRRWFADMCETYKYIHGLNKSEISNLFFFPSRQLRGHSLKLSKPRCRTLLRSHFFSHRVIDSWNSLTERAVTAPSLQAFKGILRSIPHR